MKRILYAIFSLSLLLSVSVREMEAQTCRTDTVKVYFYQGWSRISPALKDNRRALDSIVRIVQNYSRDPRFHVYIKGWASPEGTLSFNLSLSHERAAVILDYIEERTGRPVPASAYDIAGMGIDWKGLESSVMRDSSFRYRDEVLHIVRNIPIWVFRNGKVAGSRKKTLMDHHWGRTFNYLTSNHFPELRKAVIILEYIPLTPLASLHAAIPDIAYSKDSLITPPRPIPGHIPNYRLALKTNLLADAALMPSLEAEWLINRNWSIAAHGAVAWWSRDPAHRFYQIATIYPEARWWFKTKSPWHGHYLGLFAGGSWYDLENGGRGYQGEAGFVGISYGYMFPISRSLSFEVGLGAGYMFTRYEEYLPVPYMGGTHYVYQQTSQMHYFGPLKVKFAFVWRLWDADYNKRKKGGAA